MDINFNETFLDGNSAISNFYIGIPNIEVNNIFDLENIIKKYRRQNIDFLSINIFNFYLHSSISKSQNKDYIAIINKYIMNITKKYKITFIFSYSISANPIAYFDCWNSQQIFKGDVRSIKELSQYLINDKASFLTVKKPHRGILSLTHADILDEKICSIEVCNLNQDCRITDFENIYYTLLDRGWKIGAISSYNLPETSCWYTGIISRHCYSDMLIDAVKNKASYSTRIPDLKLYFSINFIPMGSVLTVSSLPAMLSFYVFAETSEKKISTIEIISNNKKIIKVSSLLNLNSTHYIYKHMIAENNTWYVVRLIGTNGVMAISSPVFVKINNELSKI